MKLEVEREFAENLGALVLALRYSKLYDKDGQAITGEKMISIYNHMDKVLRFRERILDAEKGGVQTGKIKDEEGGEEEGSKSEPTPKKKVGKK